MGNLKVILERLDSAETENLTLEEAVREAVSGDTITLNEGVYKLKETLVIDHASLTLKGQGAEKSIIASAAGGCVVRFVGAYFWTTQNIGFQHTGKRWANVVEVDGNIIDHQRNARIRADACSFSGGKRRKAVKRGGAGLLVRGHTEGEVKNCEAYNNEMAGIKVSNHAHPTLSTNVCRDNRVAGIAYDEYAAGLATSNKCHRNKYGIVVLSEAKPQLNSNTFWRSSRFGIIDWRNGDLDE